MQYKSTKQNSLQRIKNSGIPISCIVDIGVERQTSELIAEFPDRTHHLFEPVNFFFPEIRKNYHNVDHVLHEIALSDETTSLYCIVRALRKDGRPTHARLDVEAVSVDGKDIVSCTEVSVKRFEDISEQVPQSNFLLKIDVDGSELKIMNGMGEHLHRASVIVIEATYTSILARASYIIARGFVLTDIVDIVYYGNSLYQCDLVFVRSELVNDMLSPPIQQFNGELWNNAATG